MNSLAKSFEELHVYQKSRQLVSSVYKITRTNYFSRDYGLLDQIRRASVSILSNIAEGFERGTNAEFIHFLYISKGSAAEVRAQLMVAFDQRYIDAGTYQRLTAECRQISGMLSKFIEHLKVSPYRGIKYRKVFKSRAEEMNEFLADLEP